MGLFALGSVPLRLRVWALRLNLTNFGHHKLGILDIFPKKFEALKNAPFFTSAKHLFLASFFFKKAVIHRQIKIFAWNQLHMATISSILTYIFKIKSGLSLSKKFDDIQEILVQVYSAVYDWWQQDLNIGRGVSLKFILILISLFPCHNPLAGWVWYSSELFLLAIKWVPASKNWMSKILQLYDTFQKSLTSYDKFS